MRLTLCIAATVVLAFATASKVRAIHPKEVDDEKKAETKRALIRTSWTYYSSALKRAADEANSLMAADKALKKKLKKLGIDKVFTSAKFCQAQALLMHFPNSFDNKVEEFSQKIIWMVEYLKKRRIHIPQSMSLWKAYTPCSHVHSHVGCKRHSSFRNIDGSCNNVNHPIWGKGDTAQLRFFPAAYDDGIQQPRQKGVSGLELPSARQVSNALKKDNRENPVDDKRFTVALTAWGQFLDHDLTLTPVSMSENGANIQCCDNANELRKRPQCFPITIPRGDKRFKPGACMEFVRSLPAIKDQCNPGGVREVLNQNTAYIDASNVYGSDLKHANDLRDPSDKAKMKLNCQGGRTHLPDGDDKDCNSKIASEKCKLAGDERVNEAPHLTMLHTCFAKQHNKVVEVLRGLNTHWDQNRLYEESRKIIGAIAQHITQNEFLPIVLSRGTRRKYGLRGKEYQYQYNINTNPTIRNEFSTAAYRFGHSLIQTNQAARSKDFVTSLGDFKLRTTFFNPHLVHNHANGIARWASTAPCKRLDSNFVKEITNHLFEDEKGDAFDLIALNIQRGRDHGLPSYLSVRKSLGLKIPISFRDLWRFRIMSRSDAYRLAFAYTNVNDIDLFAGGMSEKRFSNGMLGETFSELVAKQFQFLKEGDRFWYENGQGPQSFTAAQLRAIRRASLSLVMCDCFELDRLPRNVFKKSHRKIPVCRNWATNRNLKAWKE